MTALMGGTWGSGSQRGGEGGAGRGGGSSCVVTAVCVLQGEQESGDLRQDDVTVPGTPGRAPKRGRGGIFDFRCTSPQKKSG